MKVITPISDSIFKKLNEEELLLINELYLEMEKYKNVIDKIKKIVNKVDYDKWELQMTSIEKIMKIQKLLEEVK